MGSLRKMARGFVQGANQGVGIGMRFANMKNTGDRTERTFAAQQEEREKSSIRRIAAAGNIEDAVKRAQEKGFDDLVLEIEGIQSGAVGQAGRALETSTAGAANAITALDLTSPEARDRSVQDLRQQSAALSGAREGFTGLAGDQIPDNFVDVNQLSKDLLTRMSEQITNITQLSNAISSMDPHAPAEFRKARLDQIAGYITASTGRNPQPHIERIQKQWQGVRDSTYRVLIDTSSDPAEIRAQAVEMGVSTGIARIGEAAARTIEIENGRNLTEQQSLDMQQATSLRQMASLMGQAGDTDQAIEMLGQAAELAKKAGAGEVAAAWMADPEITLSLDQTLTRQKYRKELYDAAAVGPEIFVQGYNTLFNAQETIFRGEMVNRWVETVFDPADDTAQVKFLVQSTINAHVLGKLHSQIRGQPRDMAIDQLSMSLREMDAVELGFAQEALTAHGWQYNPDTFELTQVAEPPGPAFRPGGIFGGTVSPERGGQIIQSAGAGG